jgi:hypothetical protein
MRRKSGGLVLIVVLGVLVLMALLASTFFTLQAIERRVTHNYTDEIRARMAAQSGVDNAVSRLQNIIQQGWFDEGRLDKSWVYYGSTVDESREPNLSTPLQEAVNPSFAWEAEHPQDPTDAATLPRTILVEGAEVGFSGSVGGTYTPNGDLFALRVLDCQSMININDGVAWGPEHSVSQNLRRLLNALGEHPNLSTWKVAPDDRLGDLILLNRPPGGYGSKWEILRLLDNDRRRFDTLSSFLTTHSWRNSKVAEPVPLSAAALSAYPREVTYSRPTATGVPIYRYGHGRNLQGGIVTLPLNFHNATMPDTWVTPPHYCAVWSLESLNPQWIEQVERAPVNVNTAGLEVLTALITDIEGFFLTSRRRPVPSDIFYSWLYHMYTYSGVTAPVDEEPVSGELGLIYRTAPFAGPGSRWGASSPDTLSAELLADEILCCRERKVSPATGVDYAATAWGGPFRSWAQFNLFLDSLVAPGGLIWDRRPIYADYIGTYSNPPPVTMPARGRYASSQPLTVVSADPTVTISAMNGGTLLELGGRGNITVRSSAPIDALYYGQNGFSFVGFSMVGSLVQCTGSLEDWQIVPPPVLNRSMGDSFVQRWHGSMAAADALKANFNPNLHLNELNPDRILYQRVDKTDLLVHSTEFCFVPMGTFEIESEGLILDNDGPSGGTVVQGGLGPVETSNNRIVARCRVQAALRLYEPIYETAQKEFYAGTFSERRSSPGLTTNNNRSVETGPEPDNGPAPMECEWDGYASLPTLMGTFANRPLSFQKPKGAWMANVPGGANVQLADPGNAELGEAIHAHFQLDLAAEYHLGGASEKVPIGPQAQPGEPSLNFPDRTETRRGPYAPTDPTGVPGKTYRLCRTFRRDPADPRSGRLAPPPAKFECASSDLRVDGAHLDQHSAVGYSVTSTPISTNLVVSFWYKPNYLPEQLGRIKTLVSLRRESLYWPFFSLNLMPCWHSQESFIPHYGGPARPVSLLTGYGMSIHDFAQGGGVGALSRTLNHEFKPQVSQPENDSRFFSKLDGRWSELRGREWCHIMMVCETGNFQPRPAPAPGLPPAGTQRLRIYVNGKLSSLDPDFRVHVNDAPSDLTLVHGKSVRLGGEYSESIYGAGSNGLGTRNYPGDGTFDEFFLWRNSLSISDTVETARQIYLQGRFYKPKDADPDDARFTSAQISIPMAARRLPPHSQIPEPGREPTAHVPPPADPVRKRLVAIAWTALAEDYLAGMELDGRPRLRPVMWDYSPQLNSNSAAPLALSPAKLPDANGYSYETVCETSVRVGGAVFGPYRNEPWSPIRASHGGWNTGSGGESVHVAASDPVSYSAKFRLGPAGAASILLATPVLDDVTLFVAEERAQFLSYAEASR